MKSAYGGSIWFGAGALVVLVVADVFGLARTDNVTVSDVIVNLVSDAAGAIAVLVGGLIGIASLPVDRAIGRERSLAMGIVFALGWSVIAKPIFLFSGIVAVLLMAAVLAALVAGVGGRILGKNAA